MKGDQGAAVLEPVTTPEFMRQIDICKRLGISDETWRRWRAAKLTPPALELPGKPIWRTSDIDDFVKHGGSRRKFFKSHR